MRTKTLLIAATALAATVISSEAQAVYSANVVGYVSRVIVNNSTGPTAPKLSFAANPLDTGNNVLTNVLEGLPVNSKVIKWDYANGTFDLVFTRSSLPTFKGWSPANSETNTVNPGEAFFVELPNGNTTGFTNVFIGSLPAPGAFTNNMLPGLTAESFQVPINDSVTNQGLNAALPGSPAGSKVEFWNESAQNFSIIYTRTTLPGTGWTGPGGGNPPTPTVAPASGFFILNNASTNRVWSYNYTNQ